ncbi:MAG: divalent-cation tolerance protein CutA [Thermoanaerobaculia bacterium]|nr:divalent-cation tolerance protein CutA [Thermoanaerobaculia bacterium]
MDEARLVLSTVGTADDAKRIAKSLVEARLAACVSITPVESCYVWEGKLVEDAERLLVIKTSASRVEELERRLREIHPYTVPEFVVLTPEHVAEPYLAWLLDSVKA